MAAQRSGPFGMHFLTVLWARISLLHSALSHLYRRIIPVGWPNSVYLPCRSKCPPHPSWNQGQNWPREGRGARRAREVVNRGREGRRLSRSLPKGEGGGRQGGREGRGRIFMALNQIALLLLLLLFPHFYSPFATVFQLVSPLFTTPEKRPRPKTGWALRSRDK